MLKSSVSVSRSFKKQLNGTFDWKPLTTLNTSPALGFQNIFSFWRLSALKSNAFCTAVAPPIAASVAAAPKIETDLEIKDSKVIFGAVWTKIENKFQRNKLKFPKEIIWLGGAPGSGKGTNTPFIQRVRGITSMPIVMSDLLNTNEQKNDKAAGRLVSDSLVLELLLQNLLKPEYQTGVIVDGFPRTKIQVEFTKMLHDKMKELRKEYMQIDDGFRRPTFRVAVLFVEESESVARQLRRGKEAISHNQKVMMTGVGVLKEVRPTDMNEDAARARYKIFKDHYSTLQTLREYFSFTLINATGLVHEVEQSIIKEFTYQSSLELGSETFDSIQRIPLVSDVIKHARQELVKRLDNYQFRHDIMFAKVVSVIEDEFVPVIKRHAIAGLAVIRSTNPIFEDQLALEMTIDILSERGYHVLSDCKQWDTPDSVCPVTNKITLRQSVLYVFQVRFQRSVIRNLDIELMQ